MFVAHTAYSAASQGIHYFNTSNVFVAPYVFRGYDIRQDGFQYI
ncbi:hypothetical protein KL86SPO_70012 [uncultured Sporomusa sp.]|uniref:Uncharacterized protein n=1 Tax=uncultured Sporomusa sp. TaxID=307249 RepID=A0A212LZY7_9FIRM|nr:hypothetical protein KL86SPO_70012 [uncultured Sporomusa sp.]